LNNNLIATKAYFLVALNLFLNESLYNYNIFISSRLIPNALSGNSGAISMPVDQLMPMCELGEISSIHSLNSTSTLSSKTSLKTHRASNNLNVVETDNTSSPRRANNTSVGESQAAGIHLNSSLLPYSSPPVFGQQLNLNLLSKNSASDPLLSVSALSSMRDTHRVNIAEGDVAQRCANNVSPGECLTGDVHSSLSCYLSPTLNLSSSSSSSSDGVSIFFAFIFILLSF